MVPFMGTVASRMSNITTSSSRCYILRSNAKYQMNFQPEFWAVNLKVCYCVAAGCFEWCLLECF